MKRSTLKLRTTILKALNDYILDEIEDENIWDIWITMGVPDNADYTDLVEIATDEDLWEDCIATFCLCCKKAKVEIASSSLVTLIGIEL